jgi:hypothetical protein
LPQRLQTEHPKAHQRLHQQLGEPSLWLLHQQDLWLLLMALAAAKQATALESLEPHLVLVVP